MAKFPKRSFDAFDLAVRQMSIVQLKKLATLFKKTTSRCETRDDYANRLSSIMSPAERLVAMQTFILAGKTSLSIYAMEGASNGDDADSDEFKFEPEFDGTAGREPTIVTAGKLDELIVGQQHIQWAVVTGSQNYLDIHLNLKVEPESVVIDSFYESTTGYLQIRANSMLAKKIAMHWAKLAHIDFEKSAKRIALTMPDQVEAFCEFLNGSVRKCGGYKKESRGFHRVSGTRHPNVPDLRGTEDYTTFKGEVDPADFQIEFVQKDKTYALGVSIELGSLSFVNITPEETMQYVYGKLKEFLDTSNR